MKTNSKRLNIYILIPFLVTLAGCFRTFAYMDGHVHNLGTFDLATQNCGDFSLIEREINNVYDRGGLYYVRDVLFSYLKDSKEIEIDRIDISNADPFEDLSSKRKASIAHQTLASETGNGSNKETDVRLYVSPSDFNNEQFSAISRCLKKNISTVNQSLLASRISARVRQRAQLTGIVYASRAELEEEVRQNNRGK